MGRFVNPDNSAFQVALNSRIYVDKSGLIEYTHIRDAATNKKAQADYINFLRGMFKGTEPTKYIQLAYLTGILPIKKEKTQSALNNFDEFTMLSAGKLAPYIGFTEGEVQKLAEEYHQDFDKVKRWYDGYLLKDYEVYNPRAAVSVMLRGSLGTIGQRRPLMKQSYR